MEQIKIHCKYDELIDPKKLKNHPKNRNKHGSDQVKRLAKIIASQGIRAPIRVSNRSGCITKGHGLKLSCILNGYKLVPVQYQDYDSAEQEYQDLIADNEIARWSDFDIAEVHLDLPEFEPFDLDLLGIKDFKLEPDPKKAPSKEKCEVCGK